MQIIREAKFPKSQCLLLKWLNNVKLHFLYSWVAYMWKIIMKKVYQNIFYKQCSFKNYFSVFFPDLIININ